MNREKEDTKGTYDKKLYAACKYMTEHREELKIYDNLPKEENAEEEIEKEYLACGDLHNKFLAQYLFIIGNGKFECTESDPKGSDIMPAIDVEPLNDKTLAEMLIISHHYTQHFIEDNKSRIRLNYRVFSVNLDKRIPMLNYLVESIFTKYIKELKQWIGTQLGDASNLQDSFNILVKYYDKKRKYVVDKFQEQILVSDIEYKSIDDFKACDYYQCQLKLYYKKLCYEKGSVCIVGCPKNKRLEEYYNMYLYIDLSCKTILQYVIQGIIKNTKNTEKLKSIKRLNDTILNMLESELKIVQEKNPATKVKLGNAPKKNLLKIYSFYYVRDRFLQDTKILKNISYKNDTEKSILENFELGDQKHSWGEIQNLFGDIECNPKTFIRRLANCFLLIKKINGMNMENEIPCSPVRLRALYRVIYLNKSFHITKRKTSMTIANEYIKNNNIENSDYYFIKELLNMELFREFGLLEEFNVKNELQENLYWLVCLYLSKLEPSQILNDFIFAVSRILGVIEEIGEEFDEYEEIQIESDKNIDNSSPSHYYEVTDGNCKEIYQCIEALFNIRK